MLRRDLLRALMTTPLTAWFKPWMPRTFGGAKIEQANAAAIYRKVFGWAEGVRKDWDRLSKAATIAIDDPHVIALLQQASPVLRSLREAATIAECHWDNEAVRYDEIGRDYLNFSNIHLMRLAYLSARRNARLGRGRAALDDVFAGLTLAHRIGTGGVFFARLMEGDGKVRAFKTIGRILTELDRATLDDLSRRMEGLPQPEPASVTVGHEAVFVSSSLSVKVIAIGPVIEEEDWGKLYFDQEVTATLKRLTRSDRSSLLVHLAANGPAYAELARRIDSPRPGCRAALDEFARAERSDHPIVVSFVESAWGVRHMVNRMTALRRWCGQDSP